MYVFKMMVNECILIYVSFSYSVKQNKISVRIKENYSFLGFTLLQSLGLVLLYLFDVWPHFSLHIILIL